MSRYTGVILAPHSHTQGAVPRIAASLAAGLTDSGWDFEVWPWGKRGDTETVVGKVTSRWRDARVIAARAAEARPDVMVIKTGLDWKSVSRDLVLVSRLRGKVPTLILQPHGSQVERLEGSGDALFKRAAARLFAGVDGVFVLSREEAAIIGRFAPNTICRVVENPYDPAWLLPTQTPRRSTGQFVTIFVGRMVAEKGALDLIEAARDVDGRGALDVVLVGEGSALAPARELVAALGMEGHVRFAGSLGGGALADEYASADVLALPTYWPEGFPTVLAEAMGFGLPLVCTRIRGAMDYLVEGRNALFVEARSPQTVREQLLRLRDDPVLQASMREANLELVRYFAPAEVAARYRRAIADVAGLPAGS